MGPWCARSHNDPVQLVILNGFADPGLRVGRAGKQVTVRVHDLWKAAGILGQGLHIDDASDVGPAVTDKDTYPGRLARDVNLRWVGLGSHEAVPGFGQQRHRPCGSRAGRHHRLGDIDRLNKRATRVHAFPKRVHGRRLDRSAEAVLVQLKM